MDQARISMVYEFLNNNSGYPNWTVTPFPPQVITNIKNDMIRISQDVSKEQPFFSAELFKKKDYLFVDYGRPNPFVWGQVGEILKALLNQQTSQKDTMWTYIHPKIAAVSKDLFEDGHYANAAEDAFIEINDRVKKLFRVVKPDAARVPDGDTAMTTVFSINSPLVEFADNSTESGFNTQKGFMQMLAGAMSALRNPKAHANIKITKEDAIRRLMFSSMLMYKIDEAVKYSQIEEI